jgi:hypothetical protein
MTTIKIHDVETGKIIKREMNAQELSKYEADKVALELAEIETAKAEAARAALLEKLGITADEAKLLLG